MNFDPFSLKRGGNKSASFMQAHGLRSRTKVHASVKALAEDLGAVKQCQFFEGEPIPDRLNERGDVVWSCKCLKPVFRRAFCEEHYFRCYDIKPVDTDI